MLLLTVAGIAIHFLFYQTLRVGFIQPNLEGFRRGVSIWATYLGFLYIGSGKQRALLVSSPSKGTILQRKTQVGCMDGGTEIPVFLH